MPAEFYFIGIYQPSLNSMSYHLLLIMIKAQIEDEAMYLSKPKAKRNKFTGIDSLQ